MSDPAVFVVPQPCLVFGSVKLKLRALIEVRHAVSSFTPVHHALHGHMVMSELHKLVDIDISILVHRIYVLVKFEFFRRN